MGKFTKYGKSLKLTHILSTGAAIAVMAAAIPLLGEVNKPDILYDITVNGSVVGTCEDTDEIMNLYLQARDEFEKDDDNDNYIDTEINFLKRLGYKDEITSSDEIKEALLSSFDDATVETKIEAKVIDIDGLSIVLKSDDEVAALLEAAKSKYDKNNEFKAVLYNDDKSRFHKICYDLVSTAVREEYRDNVMAQVNGQAIQSEKNDNISMDEKDHIVGMKFEQDINITETYVPESHIMSLEEAIELVTKEKEAKKTYTVVAGDCLYSIALQYGFTVDELLAMNPDYTSIDSLIREGDVLYVTVPEPELSVVVTERKTYEEEYELPVQYIENNTQYTTYSAVINEGTTGKRKVVANASYRDGVKISEEILAQEVETEAVARVIEIGTIQPPTYITPLSSFRISSNYGQRWGRLHGGVDLVCSVGTSVMASNTGVVVEAGWNGSYGYTVLLAHSDGRKTRYAHLSRILVSYGQNVTQGQVIALSGNTGNSTGPHLHFEMIINGARVNPLNYLY